MPSSPSTRLRFELQALGENINSWGDTRLNEALKRLEEGIAKVLPIVIGGTDFVLTSSNYIEDQARSAALILTGTPGATRKVVIPLVQKLYLVRNATDADQQIGASTGTVATIRRGKSGWVVCDGTDTVTYDPSVTDLKAPAAALDMGGQKIVNIVAGTAPTDAATLSNLLNDFGAPDGPLDMGGQPFANMGTRLNDIPAPDGPVGFAGQRITSLGAPSVSSDAANKGYVDGIAFAGAFPPGGAAGQVPFWNGSVANWSSAILNTTGTRVRSAAGGVRRPTLYFVGGT